MELWAMGAIALLVFYSNYMVTALIAPLHSNGLTMSWRVCG